LAIAFACSLATARAGDAAPADREPSDSEQGAPFADSWRKTVVLSDQNAEGKASKCIAWVDQGWLVVERRDVSGDIEWQIVLAQVGEGDKPPLIELNPNVPDGLRLSYRDGLFFIRDDFGSLRCLRQKKSAAVKWPVLTIPPNEPQPGGGTMGRQGHTYYYRTNHGWQFIARGLGGELAEYVLRMYSLDVGCFQLSSRGDASRVDDITVGAKYRLIDSSTLWDDGELLVVRRMHGAAFAFHRAQQEKLQANRKQLIGAAPPEISAVQWLNGEPIALLELKGKGAFVYYAGSYSKQVADQLSAVETLYDKYRGRGLHVVGIISAEDAEIYAAICKERDLSFPLAIDDRSNATAKRFFVWDSPSFFLIGRDGKIAGSQYQVRQPRGAPPLPAPAEIEKILRAKER